MDADSANTYPLLRQLLRERHLEPLGIYSSKDIADLFRVSTRTVQSWVHDGKLQSRNLPGGGRFLSQDLEDFLEQSLKSPAGGGR
jgi:excisionase family DNA binding protein